MNQYIFILLGCALASVSAIPSQDSESYKIEIVNGEEIGIQDAPFMASLQVKDRGHNCGAIIIAPRFVLTAAHCTYGYDIPDIYVRVGTSEHANGGRDMLIRDIHDHKDHQANNITSPYDFSLLELVYKINLTSKAQPIQLPQKGATGKFPTGHVLYVSGWGKMNRTDDGATKTLRRAAVPLLSNAQCNRLYNPIKAYVTDDMICAGNGTDTCKGDSGGPLYSNNTLYGVSSWGNSCGNPKYPGVYGRVDYILDWIMDTMKDKNEEYFCKSD